MIEQDYKPEFWKQWAVDGMPADKQRLADAAWQARQLEIDALRKELKKAEAREIAYVDLLRRASESIGNFVSDHGWTMIDMGTMDYIDSYLSATSEQIESYRAEIIALAKAAQWESDYAVVSDLSEGADILDALEAIRLNKE